jgi:NAD(P)-dependent dehydrogenase (short-subunit alcohol dehydrogenase family)
LRTGDGFQTVRAGQPEGGEQCRPGTKDGSGGIATLDGIVAVVTGASRGLGRGIALGLGEAGATVYVTGRSTDAAPGELPGTVGDTAGAVDAAGGHGVAVVCDHRDDDAVAGVFNRIRAEQGRLDVLVNNAQASPPQPVLWGGVPFWQLPTHLWDDLLEVGLRSHFVASARAVPVMVAGGRGLIINVASHSAINGKKPGGGGAILPYSVAKAGLHRLTSDMAAELDGTAITVVEVWPHATRTEGVLAAPQTFGDLASWHEPILTGRVLAALIAAHNWPERHGQALDLRALADELGVPWD